MPSRAEEIEARRQARIDEEMAAAQAAHPKVDTSSPVDLPEPEPVVPRSVVFLSSGITILSTMGRVELTNKIDRVREDDHKWIQFPIERPVGDGSYVTVKGTFRIAAIEGVTSFDTDDD